MAGVIEEILGREWAYMMALTKKNLYKKKDIKIEISFDDGGILDLKVADMLDKYGLKATFYVVIDYVGQEGYLTWENIKDLDKRGFTIGSHTCSHPQDLKKLHEEDLFYEIQNSKDMIETVLGHGITKFCYPRGRQNERVRQIVAEAGYIEARVTGKPGIIEVKDKLQMPGTIHIYQRKEYGNQNIVDFASDVFEKLKKEGGYCNVWGHSQEMQREQMWSTLEGVLSLVKEVFNS